jgi:hypothetical protein
MHVNLFAKMESLTQGSSIKCATLVSNKVMMFNMYQTRRTISSSQMNAAEIAKKLQNTVEVAKGSNPPLPPTPKKKTIKNP